MILQSLKYRLEDELDYCRSSLERHFFEIRILNDKISRLEDQIWEMEHSEED